MTKIPGLSPVKTRLAKTHGVAFAEALYTCFLQDIVIKIKALRLELASELTRLDLYILYSPLLAAESDLQSCCGVTASDPIIFEPQVGQDLGERMHHAFVDAFAKGYERVLLIGGDSPDLPPSYLKAALTALKTHAGALIPSQDGGYCLIGFQQSGYAPQLFDVEHWGSPSVLSDTLAQVQREQIDLWQGPVWQDVDDAADLRQFWDLHQPAKGDLSPSKITKTTAATAWFQNSRSLRYLRSHYV